MLLSKFHLNEARILRTALDKFPVLVAEGLSLSQRHAFDIQRRIISTLNAPAISFGSSIAIILPDPLKPADFWAILSSEDLRGYSKQSTTFGQLRFSGRRRLLGAILGHYGRKQNVFQEGFLDFYEFETASSVFQRTLSMTVLEDEHSYRLFLEPGFTVLYPLDSLSPDAVNGQNLRALEVPPTDPEAVGGGFLGFLQSLEPASALKLNQEFVLMKSQSGSPTQFARLRRTGKSERTYLVPTEYVLIKPSYQLLAQYGHLRKLRDRTLLRPAERIGELKKWYEKMFPNDSIAVGETLSATVMLSFDLIEPIAYGTAYDQEAPAILYLDNPLKFGPSQSADVQIFDPYHGIRTYGPWDTKSKDRPFDSIRPYIIYPKDDDLKRKIHRLFKYYEEGGYADKAKASQYDRSFRGFRAEFRVPFIMPDKADAGPDCETDEQYLEAADAVIEKWGTSNRDPSRIALVVFPFDQEDSAEEMDYSKDLYPRLKQRFIQAGLPSQMIDRSTLEKILFKNGKPYFDEQSYFGHILWNLALNMYVKLGGRPWTLKRELDNVNCLIGLSFTVNTLEPGHPMYVGIANIFDEYGEWVDIAPDQRQLSDEELKAWYEHPHVFYSEEAASSKLPREFTAGIVKKSILGYKNRRGKTPNNIVIHKTGTIYQVEIEGILEGIKDAGIALTDITVGCVSLIQNHGYRMYGEASPNPRDSFVVSRGTMCMLEADRALLATTGRTESSSHSLGTPQPLEVRVERPSPDVLEHIGLDSVKQYSITQLCEQLMSLTQLNWGSMRKEIKLPVTLLYSQKVASLSTRADIATLPKGYIHRPWFI